MQYYYGEQNLLRALDEAEFWKHQEAEHTAMIPVVTTNLEPMYISRLEQLGNEIGRMHGEVVKYIESVNRSRGTESRELRMQMTNIIKQCIDQSKSFCACLEEMLQNSHAVRSNQASQMVIHHQIRESQYFIGIDQLILN